MTAKKIKEQKIIPALRGIFGSWVYYSAMLPLGDVAKYIHLATEIHQSKRLSDMIQRELQRSRAKEIADYIVNQEERFFNSLVVAIYHGEPKWFSLTSLETIPENFDSSKVLDKDLAKIGFLSLSGDERCFALDGQHRLIGIRKAIKECPECADDEISLLFVAHEESDAGKQRTRRLFTTLNKRAKPVSKGAIIALDEDDTMAIVCRRLVEENEWFAQGRVAYTATNNMPVSNKTAFTTIGALYDLLTVLFCNIYGEKKYLLKYYRPLDKDLEKWYSKAEQFFNFLNEYFSAFNEFCESEENFAEISDKYRNKTGGSVLFRPIGLIILVEALWKMRSIHKQAEIADLLDHLSLIDWTLNKPPFLDIIWDASAKKMVTGTKVICRELVLHVAGEDKFRNSVINKYVKLKGVSKQKAEKYLDNLKRIKTFEG